MRILVLSDTHGDVYTMRKAIAAQPKAEVIIHCGDGRDQIDFLKENYRDKMIVAVKGNCDLASPYPPTETISICGKRIFITHGHLYNAKGSLYTLLCAAKEVQADIVVFGHTHIPLSTTADGIYMLNPGSCHGYGASYGFIDITDKGDIVTNTVKI